MIPNTLRRYALAASLLAALPAHATDGERAGFFIGFGGGFVNGNVAVDPDRDNTYSEGDGFGYAAKLTIGGGINDRFAISGTLLHTRFDIDDNEHITHLLGVTGTFWASPRRPSLYGSLTLGRQAMRADIFRNQQEFNDSESATGNAARLAVGFEFRNQMQLEAALTAVEAGGYTRNGADVSVRQLQLIGGWHWY